MIKNAKPKVDCWSNSKRSVSPVRTRTPCAKNVPQLNQFDSYLQEPEIVVNQTIDTSHSKSVGRKKQCGLRLVNREKSSEYRLQQEFDSIQEPFFYRNFCNSSITTNEKSLSKSVKAWKNSQNRMRKTPQKLSDM